MLKTLNEEYGTEFFAWQSDGSSKSANIVIPLVMKNVTVESVVDVGCGIGTWLSVWQRAGVKRTLGLDGAAIPQNQLLIPPETFLQQDLGQPITMDQRFDLVQCLEVAEHLSPEIGIHLVNLLCSMGDIVVFSAAQPGQGGDNHINERPLHYWQDLFEARGYRTLDALRPRLNGNTSVSPWYRHNMLIFASPAGLDRISSEFQTADCTNTVLVDTHNDWLWNARRAVVRLLPLDLVTVASRTSYPLARHFGPSFRKLREMTRGCIDRVATTMWGIHRLAPWRR